MFSAEVKLQVLFLAVHAFMFIALACWCFSRGGRTRWAAMGTAGAGVLGLALGIQTASAIEQVYFESSHIALKLLTSHVYTALFAAEALGTIVLAGAFVESRRTPPAPSGSIYGPG
jgi:hypothetical protein